MPLVRASRITQHAVSHLELRHLWPNCDNLAGYVRARDERIVEPGRNDVAHGAHQAVHRVDRHGAARMAISPANGTGKAAGATMNAARLDLSQRAEFSSIRVIP